MRFLKYLVACGVVYAAVPHAEAGPVTIDWNYLSADANDGETSLYASDTYMATPLTATESLMAEQNGVSNHTELEFTEFPNGQSFNFTELNHMRTGSESDYARTFVQIYFTANQNTTYDLSGNYAVTHTKAASKVYFDVYLKNSSTSAYLFQHNQRSLNTVNESFVLGQTAGDDGDEPVGSLTGALVSGQQYIFRVDAGTAALGTSDDGAAGTGKITLNIGDVPVGSTIPEPASITLWGLGTLGLGVMVRRRQRQQTELPT